MAFIGAGHADCLSADVVSLQYCITLLYGIYFHKGKNIYLFRFMHPHEFSAPTQADRHGLAA